MNASPETRILPEITWDDLRPDLIDRVRMQASRHSPNHAWLGMTDEELLEDARLGKKDPSTGNMQVNLAGLLMFGTDAGILSALPYHGTRTLLRISRTREDREDLRTNLLETHDRLMAFASRHLPDLIEVQPDGLPQDEAREGLPVSIRDLIFSELFANSLIYRDYRKPFIAKFGIDPHRVFLENADKPDSEKTSQGTPPVLANVFRQIGLKPKSPAGDSPLSRWGKAYFGLQPLVFKNRAFRFLASFPRSPLQSPMNGTHSHAALGDTGPTWNEPEAPVWKSSETAQSEIEQLKAVIEDLVQSEESKIGALQAAFERDPHLLRDENWRASYIAREASLRAQALATPEVAIPEAQLRVEPVAPVPPIVRTNPSLAPESRPATPNVQVEEKKHASPPRAMRVAATAPQAKADRPVESASASKAASGATMQAERTGKILKFCETPRYRSEIQAYVGIQNRDYFRKEILNALIEQGRLRPTLPDKPNSPKQQYQTVPAKPG